MTAAHVFAPQHFAISCILFLNSIPPANNLILQHNIVLYFAKLLSS